jgi:hypothetical protein
MNKKTNLLSKKIKDIYELIGNFNPSNDEGMLTKKSIGLVNCASCDKGIHNLSGLRGEFMSKNKMPARETTERIARFG